MVGIVYVLSISKVNQTKKTMKRLDKTERAQRLIARYNRVKEHLIDVMSKGDITEYIHRLEQANRIKKNLQLQLQAIK